MKYIALVTLLLGACTIQPPRSVSPATLEFVGLREPQHFGGISSVDGARVPGGQVRIAPGRRKIEYGCPDHIYTDEKPAITFYFTSGVAYEMFCDGSTPVVRAKQ